MVECGPAWNPYHYVHNNPINLIDPTGMSAQNPGEGEPILPNTTLPEITINATRPTFSGYAKPLHSESSDKGSRLSGYNIYGRAGGNLGEVYGGISGFSLGYENYTELGGYHGNICIHDIEAKTGIRAGTTDTNLSLDLKGSVLSARASADAGLYTGSNDKYGGELGANAGAYVAEGEIAPSVSILGLTIGVMIGGSAGSAHIGGRAEMLYDSNTNEGEVAGTANIGLGVGLKVGFILTNTKQEFFNTKSKK